MYKNIQTDLFYIQYTICDIYVIYVIYFTYIYTICDRLGNTPGINLSIWYIFTLCIIYIMLQKPAQILNWYCKHVFVGVYRKHLSCVDLLNTHYTETDKGPDRPGLTPPRFLHQALVIRTYFIAFVEFHIQTSFKMVAIITHEMRWKKEFLLPKGD